MVNFFKAIAQILIKKYLWINNSNHFKNIEWMSIIFNYILIYNKFLGFKYLNTIIKIIYINIIIILYIQYSETAKIKVIFITQFE